VFGIRSDENLIDDAISKTVLATDRRYAGALVLSIPGGKSPFTVTDSQRAAILSHHANEVL
jgi:hypothetical protein